ncbi:MAG: hypothetical protein JNM21_14675 [Taibaiella sp.]|nr:hypothetical protein [Taibaiella sp.]
MKKELPEIEIDGTIFQFDINRIALVEKDNPTNKIEFTFMEDHGTHYSFEYSAVSKNYHFLETPETLKEIIKNVPTEERKDNPPIYVEVPRIGHLDPQGMCAKYGCTLSDIEQKSDFELIVNQEAFQARVAGKPVTIDLAGKIYEVNFISNSLLPQDGNGEAIDLGKYYNDYFLEDRNLYYLFYDTKENKVLDFLSEGSAAVTMDHVIVEIPEIYKLDPIGLNEEFGYSPKMGLLYTDLKLEHEAKIVPLDEAEMLELEIEKVTYQSIYDNEKNITKEIPTINIAHTDFIIDIDKFVLREMGNEDNVIYFIEMDGGQHGYGFCYNVTTRNIAFPDESYDLRVYLPAFVELLPREIAEKYGLDVKEVAKKNDLELFLDHDVFEKRINQKLLPTIDIGGHIFFVDLQSDKLRPKDDFLSNGISFSDIKDYCDAKGMMYTIPYNPKTHELGKIDFDNITEIPKDLMVVSFPHERVLDPIGRNIKNRFEPSNNLQFISLKMHFVATPGKWEDLSLPQRIKDNLNKNQPVDNKQQSSRELRNPNDLPKRMKRKM